MHNQIDTSFQTLQNDLFSSGMAAKIGMNAFGLWSAIKNYSNYNTGECWPGMRQLADLTGLSMGTVQKCIKILLEGHLLRIVTGGAGVRANRYVARERLDVRVGNRLLCTIVMDYVPARMRDRVALIEGDVRQGRLTGPSFAECEIIPGPGFAWDMETGTLKASVSHEEIQQSEVDKVCAIPSSVHLVAH